MNNLYTHIAGRLAGSILAIEPVAFEGMLRAIGPRLGFTEMVRADGRSIQLGGSDLPSMDAAHPDIGMAADDKAGYYLDRQTGIALIEINGKIVQRHSWVNALCGFVSSAAIEKAFYEANNDPAVKGIMFNIDSAGGEVAGLFDAVDSMRAMKGDKPVHAHAGELAASGAYAIASIADHVSTPRTGRVGSIGVLMLHADYSEKLKQDGIKVTVFRQTDRKAEGIPVEPLSEAASVSFQASINESYELFVETVALNRPSLTVDAVRATNSQVFTGIHAKEQGLVDEVMSAGQALAHLANNMR